jgi:hypothetical protein
MPTCNRCHREIIDDDFLESDGLIVHEGCLDAWEAANEKQSSPHHVGPCAHCQQLITDGVYLESGADRVHKECLGPFLARHSTTTSTEGLETMKSFNEVVVCVHCNSRVHEANYTTVEGKTLHTECKDAFVAASAA